MEHMESGPNTNTVRLDGDRANVSGGLESFDEHIRPYNSWDSSTSSLKSKVLGFPVSWSALAQSTTAPKSICHRYSVDKAGSVAAQLLGAGFLLVTTCYLVLLAHFSLAVHEPIAGAAAKTERSLDGCKCKSVSKGTIFLRLHTVLFKRLDSSIYIAYPDTYEVVVTLSLSKCITFSLLVSTSL